MIAVNCIGALGSGVFGLANSPLQPISLYDFAILFVFGLTTIGLAFVIFMGGGEVQPVGRSRPDRAPSMLCSARYGCF